MEGAGLSERCVVRDVAGHRTPTFIRSMVLQSSKFLLKSFCGPAQARRRRQQA
jgi:hypothetical protein